MNHSMTSLSNEAKLIHANNMGALLDKLIDCYNDETMEEIDVNHTLDIITEAEATLSMLGFETHSHYSSKFTAKLF